MKIHILTADTYNKIAAGEVIDRPYSVVKELVENALDAGATEITVEIEGGGKSLIRVTDNGCGMVPGDLPRAYLPHATSKLSSAEDLFTVSTLGFRGEAIASIAAVSRMTIVSDGGEGAHALSCEGGVLGEVTPAAGAKGTQITVKDLFYNTPARLKFLKSDAQEEGDVTSMMARFLLSRPDVSFTYYTSGKVKYRSLGEGLSAAVATVYGAGVLENCHEIDAERHGVRLRGLIGSRNFSKPNRSYQSLFVNGRYVVNQTVGMAVSNAYSAYLMKRQYPFYVLFLDVPQEIVDVNVHPNKTDVRFADNQIIYGCVYKVISSILDGNSQAIEFLVSKSAPSAEPSAPAVPPPAAPAMTYEEAKRELQFDIPPIKDNLPAAAAEDPSRSRFIVRSPAAPSEVPHSTGEDCFEENRRYLQETAARQEKVTVSSLVYKGELFRTYLFYEAGDCAYIIDQHAAHERLIYDALREKMEKREVVIQPMLVPFLLEANGAEFAFLVKNFPFLREIGFEVEEFGGNSIKVSALPSDLMGLDLSAFFDDILSSMESLRAIRLPDLLKDKLATAACKAAVKGGEQLSEQEVRSLLERMDGDMGLKCPHGRPVAVKVKKSELEKLFKRIV